MRWTTERCIPQEWRWSFNSGEAAWVQRGYDRHFDLREVKRTAVFGTRKKPAITPLQPIVAPTLRWNFS